jgi:hypothetical protein
MAIKTFTTGEVLTASDTNTYLANSGLVYVTSVTVGSAVASVTVTGAFNSSFENYKIIWSGGNASTANNGRLTLGASATGYYASLIFSRPNTTAITAVPESNTAYFGLAVLGNSNGIATSMELFQPFSANKTVISSLVVETDPGGAIGTYSGFHNVASSFSAFTITASAGTFTGGTITVYGYRKA